MRSGAGDLAAGLGIAAAMVREVLLSMALT
jgi:hypothetical protein